jgi:hypothetical protein
VLLLDLLDRDRLDGAPVVREISPGIVNSTFSGGSSGFERMGLIAFVDMGSFLVGK